jgi:hypothetical protein
MSPSPPRTRTSRWLVLLVLLAVTHSVSACAFGAFVWSWTFTPEGKVIAGRRPVDIETDLGAWFRKTFRLRYQLTP